MPRIYGSTERTIASDEAVETARNITRFTLVSAFTDPLAPLAARADLPTCLGHAWTAQVGRTGPQRAVVQPVHVRVMFRAGLITLRGRARRAPRGAARKRRRERSSSWSCVSTVYIFD